jgi:multidrug resistance efflux pump
MPDTPIHLQRDEEMSEEVRDLVSYRPHWLVRRGSTIFLVILCCVLAASWVIKYPDMIKGSLKLVAINAPKLVVAKTDGKLVKLLVSDNMEVQEGQPLAFLQSTARHEQVIALEGWIRGIEPFLLKDSFDVLLSHPLPVFSELGEMQPAYQDFQNVWRETLQIFSHGYYQQKKAALQQDLQFLASIQNNQEQQQQLLKEDYELQQTELKANESLVNDKVIALLEFNQNKSKVIGKAQGLKQIEAQLINDNIAAHNKEKEILDLHKFVADQEQKFRSELFGLKSKLETWMREYVITAPETGKVLFNSFLEENQLLAMGQELFYVQPQESRYYGQLMAAQTGLGKIKIGQRVMIRVESYPSSEFGYLTGVVNFISTIPTGRDSFLIRVELPNGLQTSYSRIIPFRNNLMAQAEVVTDDRKLFDRFRGQLYGLMRR